MTSECIGHKLKAAQEKAVKISETRLTGTLGLMRASGLFNFAFVANTGIVALQGEADAFLKCLGYVRRCAGDMDSLLRRLSAELPQYQKHAMAFRKKAYDKIKIAGQDMPELPMPYEMWRFWNEHRLLLPVWVDVSYNVALIATSSADAERAFARYQGAMTDQ